jgi:hypothetical protein
MIRLWCNIVLKTNVKHIKRNERSYFYLYPFRDLVERNFQEDFYVCIKYINFLKTFIIENKL